MSTPPEQSEPRSRESRCKSYERLTGFQIGFYIYCWLWQHIGGSSLYDELKRLERAGLIERRGQEWAITSEGERRLRLQVDVLKRVRDVAQKRGLW